MLKDFDEEYDLLLAGGVPSDRCSINTADEALSRQEDTGSRKIFLPRGSARARFEPQPYFYFASRSGAVPSWVIDEISRGDNRSLRPDADGPMISVAPSLSP
jgi:hypothetical protein